MSGLIRSSLWMMCVSSLAIAAGAVDGVLEINQACAVNTGCFTGDSAGFPVTISSTGSYRLTSDLSNSDANLDGIFVGTHRVSIDLNGFSIIGPVSCIGGGGGLTCSGTGSGKGINAISYRHVTVVNGTIQGSGNDGAFLGDQCRFEDVAAKYNGRFGLGGSTCVVRDSSAHSNLDDGFSFGTLVIDGAESIANKGAGYRAISGASIYSVVFSNRQRGHRVRDHRRGFSDLEPALRA